VDDAGGACAGHAILVGMAICVDCERETTTGCGVEPGGCHHRDGALAWRQVCPRCGSGSVIPVLYGVRNPAMTTLEQHGVLELGDASDPARPTSRCRDCEHGWTRASGRASA
jgi:hypothetical protein